MIDRILQGGTWELALAYPVVRGLILIVLLTLVGTLTASRIMARTGVEASTAANAVRSRLARLPSRLAWGLLILSVLRGILQVRAFADPDMPIDSDLATAVLTAGSWGRGWLVQTAIALVIIGAGWLLRRSARRLRFATALLTVILLVAQAGMGHGVEELWHPAGLGRAVHFSHLLAAGLWLGTLTVLAVVVIPSLQGVQDRPILAAVIRRFSTYAQLGVGLLVLSGGVAAWTYTSRLSDLWTTGWGLLLSIKLLLLLGVAGLGWYNWKVITPRLITAGPSATRSLRRAVRIELLLGLLLIAVTAVLVATALPGEL